ncbi:inhibitor of growth protein 3 [Ditylenchus destructor]|uniref:Inhibitor of growth protein 3 n=1 Tax=Ditylenchus destructor TaxID=166010 RepID=A0AAD4MEP7_9BILA|nr:inhibitor of growth protein 3 [Ditylenchus destructor]
MHSLELDLELVEDVPIELKHKCWEMRHLDFRVEKARSEVREKSIEFFNIRNTLTQEERENRIVRIHQSYHQIRKLSEDKIAIAEHLHLMLEKYHERISRHLSEFEYESDVPGMPETRLKRNGSPVDLRFKAGPSGSHPNQLQKRITQASLDEAVSTANSTNKHYTGLPKKSISKMNTTLPSFQQSRQNSPTIPPNKTAGASRKRISSNVAKVSEPPVKAKYGKSLIFPKKIARETTKESTSAIFSANATLPITLSEMAPIKERIEHCESLFVSSQEPTTDSDDSINSGISFIDVSYVKSIEKEAFICSDDEDY